MKNKIQQIVLAAVFAALAATTIFAQQTADDYFKAGNEQYQQKNYDAAIKSYSECIRLNPVSDGCYYNRGLANYSKQNYQSSVADFTQVIKFRPQNANAYVRRGLAYTKLEKLDLVVADYEAALKIKPDDEQVKKTMATVKEVIAAEKAVNEARKDYQTAEDKQNKIAEGFYTQGNRQMGQKDYDAALASYTKCIEASPLFLDCYNNRGLIYGSKGNYDAAITDFTTIILLNPKPVIYRRRALVYRDKKDNDAAIKDFTAAIKLAPDDAENYAERGGTYIYKNDLTAAIADLTQAIKLKPQEPKYYFIRGFAHQSAGGKDAAVADYRKALQVNPNFAPANKQLQALGVQP